MRNILTQILILISTISFGQELTSIKISVPNKTDEVYIVGNQESLGNWEPNKIKLKKISEYEREISLDLSFPAEYKFTRGNWESEAIIDNLSGQPNFILNEKPKELQYYKIQGWSDQIDNFSTFSDFSILNINSNILNQKRKIYVSLPENYNENIKYPVVYVTDANILNIYEIVVQTIRQQSNFSNFPQCIVVGIFINIRERNNELDIQFGENGKNFKDYIFKEIIPFINSNYSTSEFRAIYGHSNGAEYNHYLMFDKENPFDAFINISENLIDLENGQLENITRKYNTFLDDTKKPIKYFIASAKYDDPNRYPSGIEIEKIISNNRNEYVDFKHKIYKSWHVDLIGYSVLDAFQFIFSDYQDYEPFESQLIQSDFNYSQIKKEFITKNERYIQPYIENENSTAVIGEIALNNKNPKVLAQYLENEDTENEIFNNYQRAYLFYEINDLNTALSYLEKIVNENDQNSLEQILNSNGELFIEVYEKLNKLDSAIKNLDILQKKNPDVKNEIKKIKDKIK